MVPIHMGPMVKRRWDSGCMVVAQGGKIDLNQTGSVGDGPLIGQIKALSEFLFGLADILRTGSRRT